jgi:phospholipase C
MATHRPPTAWTRSVSRRDLIRGGAALGATAVFAPGLLGRSAAADTCSLPPGALPFPGRPAGQPQPDLAPELANIDHIFLVMMENKSFDAYFGMLPWVAPTRGRLAGRVDGFRALDAGGRPTDILQDKDGLWYQAFRNQTSCATAKPDVSWDYSHHAYNGGALDGFVSYHSGRSAMGYWDHAILPTYYSLAAHFPVGDRYFSSTLASTDPNRLFSVCASAVGITDTMRPSAGSPTNLTQVTPPNGHIYKLLDDHNIGWATFCGNLPTVDLIAGGYNATHQANVHSGGALGNDGAIAQLQLAIDSGLLPPVVTIEPDFVLGSEENPGDIDAGQYFVYQAISAIMGNSALWMRSLIIFCHDESGGYYDHVIPPPALQPGDGMHPNLPQPQWFGDDYTRYGFRVPNVVISPWARADHVSHVVRDHSSWLRTLEAKWNLPALTARDANAADFRECLVSSGPPPFGTPPAVAACPKPDSVQELACNQGRADTGAVPGPVPAPRTPTRPEAVVLTSVCAGAGAAGAGGAGGAGSNASAGGAGLSNTSASDSPSLAAVSLAVLGLGVGLAIRRRIQAAPASRSAGEADHTPAE